MQKCNLILVTLCYIGAMHIRECIAICIQIATTSSKIIIKTCSAINYNYWNTSYSYSYSGILSLFCSQLASQLPYSRKILRDPIFEDFEGFRGFSINLKNLSSNFFQVKNLYIAIQLAIVCYHSSATSISMHVYV